MSTLMAKDKETNLKDIRHEHPLNLIDLQLIYQDYQEDDDDIGDDELITLQKFKCSCDRCGKNIDWYHRYYYQCSQSSCNYSLHKFCAELPITLQYSNHPSHTLVLENKEKDIQCQHCKEIRYGIYYRCYICKYLIDLPCATLVDQNTIHHPGHPHPLVSVRDNDILCFCFACAKKHEGAFYHCIICLSFSIHVDCVSLPIKLSLRDNPFIHPHLLTLSYSVSGLPYDCKCPVCAKDFKKQSWIYKCSKCLYYIHLDCATSRREAFVSIGGVGNTRKNFQAIDYPHLNKFPLLDETYNIIPLMIKPDVSRDIKQTIDENGNLIHFIHEHPLILIQEDTKTPSSSRTKLIQFHSPMKRIRLLCNGCTRPITSFPYYKCSKEDDFVLHEWCTKLPIVLRRFRGHRKHTLFLKSRGTNNVHGVFECSICNFLCNGFAYRCLICKYYIDINCAYMPENIVHEAHPNHLLRSSVVESKHRLDRLDTCSACLNFIQYGFCFTCRACDFKLHHECALYLVKTIRHKYDEHPLRLSYSPILNHKSDYFCEICENQLSPYMWFYHCSVCSQSMHSNCTPLILNFEQVEEPYPYDTGVYRFINLKLGGVFKTDDHSHPLSLVIGTGSHDRCSECLGPLKHRLVFKCFQCEFGRHYKCFYVPTYLLSATIARRRGERFLRRYIGEIIRTEVVRPTTIQWKSSTTCVDE